MKLNYFNLTFRLTFKWTVNTFLPAGGGRANVSFWLLLFHVNVSINSKFGLDFKLKDNLTSVCNNS